MAQIQQDALRRTGSGRPDLLQRVLLDPIRDVDGVDSGVDDGQDDVSSDVEDVVFAPIVPKSDDVFEVAQPTQFGYLRDVGLLFLVGILAGSLFGFVAGLSVFP